MQSRPIGATPGGGWIKDSSGMMAPVGSGFQAKELMQLPKEMREFAIAANTLIRGNFPKELWPKLSMLISIGYRHRLTWTTIASITAGSMAENGQATTNTLQAMVNMLVPSALSPYHGQPQGRFKDKHRFSKDHDRKVAEEDE